MSLYLIAHKVRGQPAFDIAEKMDMPAALGGPWWIIPTSGHRAYPYWHCEIEPTNVPQMPAGLVDHYSTRLPPLNLASRASVDQPRPEDL